MAKIIVAAFEGVSQKELKAFETWLNGQLLLTPFKEWTIIMSKMKRDISVNTKQRYDLISGEKK